MRGVVAMAAGVGALTLGLPGPAGAQDGQADMESCLQPLPRVEQAVAGTDEVTQRKVDALVEAAKQLCEEDEAALAQEKFARALAVAEGPEQGPVER